MAVFGIMLLFVLAALPTHALANLSGEALGSESHLRAGIGNVGLPSDIPVQVDLHGRTAGLVSKPVLEPGTMSSSAPASSGSVFWARRRLARRRSRRVTA